MIADFLGGCLEEFGHWIFGPLFFLVGCYVLLTAGSSNNPLIAGYLGFLLLHTSAMLIVGFGLKKFKKFLAISWVVSLLAFITAATIAAAAA